MSATARTDTSATTLFAGTERFFRPGYAANLVSGWIPALDGVEAKLRSGARVADIGCGHGASTILMRRRSRGRASWGSTTTTHRSRGHEARRSKHVLETLAPDGTWLIVEPYAGDRLEDNLGPVGRVFYGSSARPPRATRRSGSRSAPRRARRASARSSPRVGSRASGVPPRRLSTSCWRRARNG